MMSSDKLTTDSSVFLKELAKCSEKAANIARIIKSEKYLFQLLIEKKSGEAANSRFVDDFKTLADVLIQESIKHDLSKKFPGMGSRIFGEEKNVFTNKLNESIEVEVLDDETRMTNLLCKILDGNERAARMLSKCTLEQVNDSIVEDVGTDSNCDIDLSNTAVWIDPIDATEQYINGQMGIYQTHDNGIEKNGLPCCIVLIGAYDTITGCPFAGVCNQPFYYMGNDKCSSRILSGYSPNSMPKIEQEEAKKGKIDSLSVVMSSSEEKDIVEKLKGFKLYNAPGAGYKSVCVLDDLADIYVLRKGTTFLWDTCAPHAILLSMGGGILEYDSAIATKENIDVEALQIKYHGNRDNARNKNGLVVYKNVNKLKLFLGRL